MKHYFLMILLLATAGCVGIPNLFGSDVLNIQENTIQSGAKDVVVIKDSQTIPNGLALPNQDVLLSFVLSSQEKQKTASSVKVDLFSAVSFKNENGVLCDSVGRSACVPNICSSTQACTLLAGEEKQITFRLKSPTDYEIGGIKHDATLEYRVLYDFGGTLLYTMPVVNLDEILKRQRAGDKVSIPSSRSHGSGPMQIDSTLLGTNYVLAGQDAILQFKIENDGSGTVKDSKILPGSFSGAIPTTTQFCTSDGGCQQGQSCNLFFSGAQGASFGVCASLETGEHATGGMVIIFPPGVDLPEYKSAASSSRPSFYGVCTVDTDCETGQKCDGGVCVATGGTGVGTANCRDRDGKCDPDETGCFDCRAIGKTCASVVTGETGTCQDHDTYSCTGTWVSNLCTGPSDVVCCLTGSPSSSPNPSNPVFKSGTSAELPLFDCRGSAQAGWTCWNQKAIEIFRDESRISIRFKMLVDKSTLGDAPFKTMPILARVFYTYELRNSVAITVNPFQNV